LRSCHLSSYRRRKYSFEKVAATGARESQSREHKAAIVASRRTRRVLPRAVKARTVNMAAAEGVRARERDY